jgi:(p)ppGpp synthase/HD superfamily hydrolase
MKIEEGVMNTYGLVVSSEVLAESCHKDQMYGCVKYIEHVKAVVRQVVESFGCHPYLEDVAWLHDVVEDCEGVTLDVLRQYGTPEVVVNAVDLLTKKDGVSYEDYINNLVEEGDLAWKVKVADTLSNLAASVIDDESRRVKKYSLQLVKLYGGKL